MTTSSEVFRAKANDLPIAKETQDPLRAKETSPAPARLYPLICAAPCRIGDLMSYAERLSPAALEPMAAYLRQRTDAAPDARAEDAYRRGRVLLNAIETRINIDVLGVPPDLDAVI